MDEKKKSVSEETKVANEELNELVGFEDVRNALKKIDEKKAVIETETKDAVKQLKTDTIVINTDEILEDIKEEKKDEVSEAKTELKKEEVSEDKKETKKEDASEDKKETKKEETSEDKKEVKKEDSSEDKKEVKKEDASGDKKEVKKEEVSEDKKETKKEETSEDKKETKKDEASEDKKEVKKDETSVDKKEENKAPEKAVVKEEKKGKKGIAIFFGSLVAVLAIVYLAGLIYFSNYFYPSVAINGTNVSNMNKDVARTTLDEFNKNYILNLETIDGKKVMISGVEIDMVVQLQDDMDKCIKEQKPYLWFMNVMKHHDFAVNATGTWNQDKLDSIYKNMKILDAKLMIEPKDAYIGIEDGKFAIVEEVMGTTIDTDRFKTTVNDSLAKAAVNVNLQDAGCYNLPKVYSTDESLTADFAEMSEFVEGIITLQLDDLTVEPDMELYDAVLEKSGDSYTVSKKQVQNYVKELAAQYDTIGTERTFTSTYGGNRKVKISGDAFGYEIDQEATTNALYNALQSKKTMTVDVVFKSKGYTLQGENDIGDTYIECNLSEQKVVAYKDGKKIAEGDCVSGCEALGNGTCLGLYKIQSKLSPTVLRGPQRAVTKTVTKKNKKGKKVKVKETKMEYEYESPVTFWMQFNGGYGLHDAAGWRSAYGGSIYYYDGSHGCVNLPYDLAEKLYKNFDIGDPVVVYFYDNENRK